MIVALCVVSHMERKWVKNEFLFFEAKSIKLEQSEHPYLFFILFFNSSKERSIVLLYKKN